MKITARTTLKQLAAIVVQKLSEKKISATLVGGAVVSIYTKNKYESNDLDFISPADHESIRAALNELGFKPKGRGFVHSQTEFSVEFPLGPIAIGNEEPVEPEGELRVGKITVKLLSPTQSVMDRLSWFYHSNDRQCLDQAVLIATSQNIDIKRVQKWSEKENSSEKFEIFLRRFTEKIGTK